VSRTAGDRRYKHIWEAIKLSPTGESEVEIPEYQAYSQNQLARIQKTIRKAVINEKCRDYAWKSRYRDSLLTVEFVKLGEEAGVPPEKVGNFAGKIKFKINRDTTDCTKLF
jgi:hypothetical protein